MGYFLCNRHGVKCFISIIFTTMITVQGNKSYYHILQRTKPRHIEVLEATVWKQIMWAPRLCFWLLWFASERPSLSFPGYREGASWLIWPMEHFLRTEHILRIGYPEWTEGPEITKADYSTVCWVALWKYRQESSHSHKDIRYPHKITMKSEKNPPPPEKIPQGIVLVVLCSH